MSKQFVSTVNKIQGLRTELFRAHSSFRAFEVIQEMRAPNIIDETDAARNAKAIGDYKGFFNIAEHSLNTEFLVALAKLYDRHPQATSIPKLINYIRSNINHLTIDDFAKHYEDSPGIEDRKSDYIGVKEGDLRIAEGIIDDLSPSIEKLKNLRDKRIAHLEIKSLDELGRETGPKEVSHSESSIEDLTYGEIIELTEKADQILNKLSSLIYRDVAWFEPLKETVKQDSEKLIKLLRKTHDSVPTSK